MKNRTKKNVLRSCSVALVSMVIAGAALIDSGTGLSVISAATGNSSGLIDVSDQYNTASLRSEYLNSDVFSLNTSVKNEERWVIVDLGGTTLLDAYESVNYAETFADYMNTTAAYNVKAQIGRAQNAFLKKLSASGVEYEWKYSYSTVNNGVAIKVKNCDIAAIKAMGEVAEVYSSEAYAVPEVAAVSNNANVYSTGIYKTDEVDQQGEGMVVAVLDTGLDYTHPAFQNMPAKETLGLSESAVAQAVNSGELQAYQRNTSFKLNDFYINDKIPFAYDYADDDANVYPTYSTHGTHVAGIVAGQDDSKVVKEGATPEENETFIGVAPQAQLVICKVFTDDLENRSVGSANAIDILAALSDCVTLGVDVINMSLGTSAGFSEEGFAEAGVLADVYERIEAQGISLVTAASNDYSSGFGGSYGTNLASNPDSGTVGSPSTYESALSVASINGQQASYFSINGDPENVAFVTESANANGKAYKFVEMLYESQNADTTKELTMNYVIVGGVGNAANYTAAIKTALRSGNCIAVVKRGDISFAEKVNNAMVNGAAGVIVYNNVSGSIRMSLGDVNDPVPTCSISMDAGKLLVDGAKSGRGTLTFSYSQAAGPFMSDFSSWGPTPDLKIKPEITAHGGEITSAVPGGYEVMSGTSMATPNMAGAIALLRQYAQTKFGLTKVALNDRVYQLLMSTATMALNEEGNPYSPRKQGAGLAGINQAVNTEAYLTIDDNGSKPKIELGDDPEKTGVYEFSFTVNSFSQKELVYTPEVYVMTESLSTDLKTVAEKAYMLENCEIEITAGGKAVTDTVTVPAGGKLELNVKITLDAAARKYLDETFENGMYVEGFVRLNSEETDGVDLGIPYLAFYGDWTSAPMFDYSIYQVEESKADKSVEEEDKLKASSVASSPLGFYDDEKYIFTLGCYAYTMSDNYTAIVPSDDYAVLSCYDYEGRKTVYELYALAAGMLRSAKKMEVQIVDAATKEVIYSVTEDNVRKSYAAGGSGVGSYITLRLDPFSWDLSNNRTYVVNVSGVLDYDLEEGRESTTQNDSFSFKFTIDTESPRILDTRLRYEPYTENDETKYRIYLDADVYDNQYAMSFLPCYRKDDGELALLSANPIPIYSTKGGVTTVSYEVTDCFEDYVKAGKLYLSVQDYALNESVYEFDYQSATQYPSSIKLNTDDKLTVSAEHGSYPIYDLALEQYEAYTIEVAEGLSDNTGAPALSFICSGGLQVKDNQIFTTASSGTETVTVRNAAGNTLAVINVKIRSGGHSAPIIEKVAIAPMTNGTDYLVPISSGSVINLKPNTTRQIEASVEPWYSESVNKVKFIYESTNEKVLTVNENGLISTIASGYAYVTVRIEGNSMAYTRFRITVDDELDITNNVLYHYYGGAYYKIPDDKNIVRIEEDAFKDNTLLEELVLPISLTSLPEGCFSGCVNLRKITIPAECVVINANAFAGCTSLEEIVLVQSVDKITGQNYPGTLTVGRNAFKDCVNLKTIVNENGEPMQTRITAAYDYAFAGCTALESIDISGLRFIGSHVFEGCTSLETVTMSKLTQIGNYMFNGCESLNHVTYYANAVPESAFRGCSKLDTFAFDSSVSELFGIGTYAFAGTALTEFTLPNGSYKIGAYAFEGCGELSTVALSRQTQMEFGASVFGGCASFETFNVSASDYYEVKDGLLLSLDGSELILAPFAKDGFKIPNGVVKIGAGAFAGAQITSVDLNGVKEIGAYAFAGSALTAIDLSGIEIISEGAFRGCGALASVTFGNQNTEIGAYAFAECGALRQVVEVPNATTIGAYAFYQTPIFSIAGDKIESIGAHAFEGTNLFTISVPSQSFKTIELPSLKTLGDFAFANIGTGFQSIKLGPVTEMGEHVFADCIALSTVEFAEGAKTIGSFAFVSADVTFESIVTDGISAKIANNVLTTVKIPSTVESIGDFAFLYALKLSSAAMDLSGVETVGMGAFWNCSSVTDLDLSGAVSLGDYAFALSGITTANLLNATQVGAYAFAESSLRTLNMPVMESIGPNAFTASRLTTVEIPSTLKLKYENSWEIIDSFGESSLHTGRYFNSFGSNAFAYITTLQTITVEEGSEDYFVDDYGVLYGVVSGTKENGTYVLVQYPAGNIHNPGRTYTVLDNTVRIGDGAFYYVSRLDEVRFPHTLKEIGSRAFYYCANIKKYVFESVEAPVLEASYSVMPYDGSSELEALIAEFAHYYGMYYNNFYNYAAYALLGGADFGLTLVRPENGTGYDNTIWTAFFKTVESGAYAYEEYTREVEAWLEENLPAKEEVTERLNALITDEEKLGYVKSLSEGLLSEARSKYNNISSDGQRALIAEQFEKLVTLETLVRDTREELGDPVALVSLTAKQSPKRTYYVGQTYDPSAMVLRAIYDDSSEVLLTADDLTLVSGITDRPFTLEDDDCEIVYSYGGLTYTVYITVIEEPEEVVPPQPGNPDDGGSDTLMIVGIVVGCAVVAAGGVVAAVLVLKKRKKTAESEEGDFADPDDNDHESD